MTVIYGIFAGDESVYFATKAEALREARLWARSMYVGDEVEVSAYRVANLPKRELYCRFLNGHWCVGARAVAAVPGKMKREEN